ncbi:MAG: hypothetical protein HXY49_01195 [Ignavibacteriaceae bacterium]|nr:hypothetical protein [Ignavibacteriaceae bacterium]
MKSYLEDIKDQPEVKRTLTQFIISDKIPHALLFSGQEGIGKDFCAIRFAQEVNSRFVKNRLEAERIISGIENFSEPYIKFICPLPRGKSESELDGPYEKLSEEDLECIKEELSKKISNPYYDLEIPNANNIKINSIRDIKKFLSFSIETSFFRFILISDAHLMSEAAQNSLLKSLEEPPAGFIFILTTSQPDLLRSTIRSRCWNLNFQPLSNDGLSSILTNFFNINESLANSIAPFAGGSVSIAVKLFEHDFETLINKVIVFLRQSLGKRYNSAFDEIKYFLTDNSGEMLKLLIYLVIIWLNDVQKFRYQTGNYYFNKHVETLEKFNNRFPDLNVNQIVNKLEQLQSAVSLNINLNTIAINLIMELAKISSIKVN